MDDRAFWDELWQAHEAVSTVVARVWTDAIGMPDHWSSEQRAAHLEAETERIEAIIDSEVESRQRALIAEYRRDHGGEGPDYLTTVALLNQARANTHALVLDDELFSLVPDVRSEAE